MLIFKKNKTVHDADVNHGKMGSSVSQLVWKKNMTCNSDENRTGMDIHTHT